MNALYLSNILIISVVSFKTLPYCLPGRLDILVAVFDSVYIQLKLFFILFIMFFKLGDFCLKAACQLRSMKTFLKTFDVTRIIAYPISEECSCYLNQLPTRRLEVRKVYISLNRMQSLHGKNLQLSRPPVIKISNICSFCN